MSSVKFINEIIQIYFSAHTFQRNVDQCYPIFHWSWNFWELFSLISFLKNFSRMKWPEELQLPITINHSFLSSYKWKKCSSDIRSFDSLRKFFAKVISCFKSFSLNEYDLLILSSVFLIEMLDLWGKSWNTRKNCFWIITENSHEILWGCRTCVGRFKTAVTNH